jgi:hypothetical protein
MSRNSLSLNYKDLLCRRIFLPKNKKLKILNNCQEYINKNLSVEKILIDSYKIEKILHNYLKTEYIRECDFIKIPYNSIFQPGKIFEKGNTFIRNIIKFDGGVQLENRILHDK